MNNANTQGAGDLNACFKTWRIMHTDYRRPIETFPTTISTVIALHFYKIA